jgi:hypothetical protein
MLGACTHHPVPKYFWLSNDGRGGIDTILIDRIDVDSFPSGAKTYFYYSSDTTHYFVRPDTLLGSQRNLYQESNQPLRLFYDTILYLGSDTFHIYEFIEKEDVADGASIHYWDTRFGIYATHSATWPGVKILQTDDTIQNKKLKFLIKSTVPEFFLRGKIGQEVHAQ